MSATREQTKFIFRAMTTDDISDVVAIEKICFPDPWPRSAFSDILNGLGHGALVVLHDNKVIAYGCYLIISNEAHLTNLAVLPDFRRKGVAQRILGQILDITKRHKCEYIILEVRPGNKSGIAFYEKSGFKLLYRRPKYYRNPVEDALVMVYYLDESES